MPKVRTFAQLRSIIGNSEIKIAGTTLKEVILNLAIQFPQTKPYLIVQENPLKLYGHWDFIVNGNWITEDDNFLEHPLSEKDTLSIVPPIGGG